MEEKKRLLLLTTGGTIASVPGADGLEPKRSEVMEREVNQLRTYYDITVRDVLCLDSSNITPDQWLLIAESIFTLRSGYDGIVVSHGTDTMAYTASAVTFLLPDIDVPVVFTGSSCPWRTCSATAGQSPNGLRHGGFREAGGVSGLRPEGYAGLPVREAAGHWLQCL